MKTQTIGSCQDGNLSCSAKLNCFPQTESSQCLFLSVVDAFGKQLVFVRVKFLLQSRLDWVGAVTSGSSKRLLQTCFATKEKNILGLNQKQIRHSCTRNRRLLYLYCDQSGQRAGGHGKYGDIWIQCSHDSCSGRAQRPRVCAGIRERGRLWGVGEGQFAAEKWCQWLLSDSGSSFAMTGRCDCLESEKRKREQWAGAILSASGFKWFHEMKVVTCVFLSCFIVKRKKRLFDEINKISCF